MSEIEFYNAFNDAYAQTHIANNIDSDVTFDNKEVTLKIYLSDKTKGEQIFTFVWWSNNRRKEYVSMAKEQDQAVREFLDCFPNSKGSSINVVKMI